MNRNKILTLGAAVLAALTLASCSQKKFNVEGAITQAEHDKSLHELTVKMGEAKISATTEGTD